LLLSLASRRFECRYYVSNCGEIGFPDRL